MLSGKLILQIKAILWMKPSLKTNQVENVFLFSRKGRMKGNLFLHHICKFTNFADVNEIFHSTPFEIIRMIIIFALSRKILGLEWYWVKFILSETYL